MSEPADKPTMRTPFPDRLINKLPKGTKAQNECPANEKVNCKVCGGWHHPKIIHLDYVGHAALTDRLLDVDPSWNWEPLAYADGLPAFDSTGGLWIKLTVSGVTRLGYGNAAPSQYKDVGAREKEVIGDALRNAAMRFGAALDLWFKGELHPDEPKEKKEKLPTLTYEEAEKQFNAWVSEKLTMIDTATGEADNEQLVAAWGKKPSNVRTAITKFGNNGFPQQQNELTPEAQAHINSIKE